MNKILNSYLLGIERRSDQKGKDISLRLRKHRTFGIYSGGKNSKLLIRGFLRSKYRIRRDREKAIILI